MTETKDWKALEQSILGKLDIQFEYEQFGVQVVGSSPNTSGWLSVRAMGREDRNPSAGINVGDGSQRGLYVDHGGVKESLNFWKFAVQYGPFGDLQEVVNHYRQKTKPLKSLPKIDQEASLSLRLEASRNDQLDEVQPPVQSDSESSDPNPIGDDDQVENPEKEDLSMKFLSNHLEELARSGISQNQAETSGLYSCSDDAEIRRLFNWNMQRKQETKLGPALVFPFFNDKGEQLDYSRLKLDHPRRGKDGKAIKYEAPKDERNHAYFPSGSTDTLEDSKSPVLITEGEKKALKANLEGFPCIGLTGIWGWQKKRNKDKNGKSTGERKLIPELEAIIWKDRDVFIVFDSDRNDNFMILQAEWALTEVLASKGAKVRIVELPPDGDEKVGLDDYLLKHSAADFQSLIDAAVEPKKPDRKQFEIKNLETAINLIKKDGATAAFEESVLEAFAKASIYDKPAYGKARAILREFKVGLRDFDRALKPIIEKMLSGRPAGLARNYEGNYFVEAGCICRRKSTPDGPITVQTNNFTAEIVADVSRDDGAEVIREYEIKGELHTGQPLPTLSVPAIKFGKLEWIPEHWGAKPIVWPGEHHHIPAAIQGLSKKTKLRAIFAHSGWRKLGRCWVYLHGEGAIGNPIVSKKIKVELPDSLKRFCLPTPPAGNDLDDAIRASLELLEIGEAAVTYPIVASVFRSVLGSVDFSMGLFGASGVFKTQMAALAQQFFGPELDAAHLPASWTSTVNSNEGLSFATKDAVFVIDDFAPGGSANDVQRLHRDADRLLRGAANGTGRGRMRSDGSLRPTKY